MLQWMLTKSRLDGLSPNVPLFAVRQETPLQFVRRLKSVLIVRVTNYGLKPVAWSTAFFPSRVLRPAPHFKWLLTPS